MRKHGMYFLSFMVILALWELACREKLWTPYILPPPERVWETLQRMISDGELFHHVLISTKRILWGFLWAFLLSCCFSAVSLLLPKAAASYSAILEVFRHVPPLSLIPLLILWFGIGELPKTIIIVLASFFPMYLNMQDGLARCDDRLLEVGRMLRFTPLQQLWQIRLPAALPGILTGMKVGMGYSLRAIIGAEMIAADQGLGYLILDAQAMSRSDKVIIGILAIGCLGLILDGVCSLITYVALPYEWN